MDSTFVALIYAVVVSVFGIIFGVVIFLSRGWVTSPWPEKNRKLSKGQMRRLLKELDQYNGELSRINSELKRSRNKELEDQWDDTYEKAMEIVWRVLK